MPALPIHPTQPPGWPRWAEALAVVAFWALLGAVALVRRALDPNPPFSLHTVAVTAVEYGPWLVLTPAVFWLARRLPLERKRWVSRLALHLAIAGAATLALGTLHRLAIPALGPPQGVRALPEPPSAQGATAEADAQRAPRPSNPAGPPGGAPTGPVGPPLAAPSLHFAFYLFVLGVGFARAYAIQVQARQAEADRLEAETARLDAERARLAAQLTEAQLGALRMQLNPHSFFNALNAVSALAGTDPAAVRQIVARLAALLRRVLDSDAADEVPLREELAFLHDYLDVQRVQFEGGLKVEEDLDADTLDALVPSLILQPLVENAIEHGVGKVREGGGRITLRARREQGPGGADRLVVGISDNGPGLPAEAPGESRSRPNGIGLANTRARLEAHYGAAGTLTLRGSPAQTAAIRSARLHLASTGGSQDRYAPLARRTAFFGDNDDAGFAADRGRLDGVVVFPSHSSAQRP